MSAAKCDHHVIHACLIFELPFLLKFWCLPLWVYLAEWPLEVLSSMGSSQTILSRARLHIGVIFFRLSLLPLKFTQIISANLTNGPAGILYAFCLIHSLLVEYFSFSFICSEILVLYMYYVSECSIWTFSVWYVNLLILFHYIVICFNRSSITVISNMVKV